MSVFEKLLFYSKPILKVSFVLQVDASDGATRTVLLQGADDGLLHPTCYASSGVTCSIVEKEALALLMSLDKFEVYLGDTANDTIVFSDHKPLQFVIKMKNKNQRLTRWFLTFQHYKLIIKHIRGHENLIADALLRTT